MNETEESKGKSLVTVVVDFPRVTKMNCLLTELKTVANGKCYFSA